MAARRRNESYPTADERLMLFHNPHLQTEIFDLSTTKSLLPNPNYDSAVYDLDSHSSIEREAPTSLSIGWQKAMLRPWVLQHRRNANEMEMLGFLAVLKLSRTDVEQLLLQLHEETASSTLQKPCSPRLIPNGIVSNFDLDDHSQKAPDVISDMAKSALTHVDMVDLALYNQDIIHSDHAPVSQTTCRPAFLDMEQLAIHDMPPSLSFSDEYEPFATCSGLNSDHLFASHTVSTSPSTSTLYIPRSQSDSWPTVPTQTIPPKQRTESFKTTKALVQLARNVMYSHKKNGCKQNGHRRGERGPYKCTLGCDYRSTRPCDWERHEQTVYPQRFWFCFICGDATNPSTKHLFTRNDKLRNHLREFHASKLMTYKCELVGIRPEYPSKCEICLHHRHSSWEARREHIIGHYRTGDRFPRRANRLVAGTNVSMLNVDDQDDDDDDDSGDDYSDHDADDLNEEEDGPYDSTSKSPNNENEDPDNVNNGDISRGSSDELDMSQYLQPEFLAFNSKIKLHPLRALNMAPGLKQQRLHVHWKERVNHKGGTSSVYKVILPLDLDTGDYTKSKIYAVKQYPASARKLFEHELEIFRILGSGSDELPRIVRCYGTFQALNKKGQLTHNLLLEYGQCDLREYWADTPKPRTPGESWSFWRSLCDLAAGLLYLHNSDHALNQRGIVVHGDVKPDNIVLVGDTWKFIDFGSASILDSDDSSMLRSGRSGGTRGYYAPEIGSEDSVQPMPASDIWSFGKVLLEAATWVSLGFAGLNEQDRFASIHKHDLVHRSSDNNHEHAHHQSLDPLTRKMVDLIAQCGLMDDDPNLRPTASLLELYSSRCSMEPLEGITQEEAHSLRGPSRVSSRSFSSSAPSHNSEYPFEMKYLYCKCCAMRFSGEYSTTDFWLHLRRQHRHATNKKRLKYNLKAFESKHSRHGKTTVLANPAAYSPLQSHKNMFRQCVSPQLRADQYVNQHFEVNHGSNVKRYIVVRTTASPIQKYLAYRTRIEPLVVRCESDISDHASSNHSAEIERLLSIFSASAANDTRIKKMRTPRATARHSRLSTPETSCNAPTRRNVLDIRLSWWKRAARQRMHAYPRSLTNHDPETLLCCAHSIQDLSIRMDQYLSGRQERPVSVLLCDTSYWKKARLGLMQLLSEFSISPRRCADKDNLRIYIMLNNKYKNGLSIADNAIIRA